ncbi:MAG: permease [Rhodobacteraceae bacterium]|uniref:permease n=1 Tax=Marivita sp. TaxID=2003365 RepID=UPI003B526291|nr:permease [Paracoccaceae bacterium]
MNDITSTGKRPAAASSCDTGDFVLPGDPPPRLQSAKAASCCGDGETAGTSCCGPTADADAAPWRRVDWLLWGSGAVIAVSYLAAFVLPHDAPFGLGVFTHGVQEMMNLMWWGILVGMLAVGLIDRVPRAFVIGIIGRDQGAKSLVRAVLAGVLLDLCNHGVLMVGAKLYERGASLGQVFAFLIASPWNSLSLTIIIGVLMGWQWMAVFLVASLVIALVTGLAVEALERAGRVKPNPNRIDLPADFHVWRETKAGLRATRFDAAFAKDIAARAFPASRMVLRWLFFGVVLAALIQATVPTEIFATLFGATLLGLFTTLVAATIIEVCSEGSVPIAADLMTRAAAPGNAFTFLMAGAATDYTEMLVLREVTGRLKAALLLPLLTVPQVLVIGWALNMAG